MTLHIVSKSPYSSKALADCFATFTPGDALLLIEDGVYALSGFIADNISVAPVYCLAADARARGIEIPRKVQGVDDAGWVTLCTEHQPIVSWFK